MKNKWEIPEFSKKEFIPRAHPYCIVLFAINEGERIRAQLRRMHDITRVVDVIVADGGSTDGSLDEQFLAEVVVRTLLTKTGAGRLSAQMRMALSYALEEGYEGVIVMDGNNKDDPAATSLFIKALDAGFDHVQGSRYIPGGKGINTPWARHYGVQLLHAPLISLAAGFRYTDTTNGFRAYSRRLLLDSRVDPFRAVFADYQLHYYLAIRAARLGFKVCEVPVTRAYPKNAPAPTKISPIRGNLKVVKNLVATCVGYYNPPKEKRADH